MSDTSDNITVLPMSMANMQEQFHAVLREVADFNAIYETLQEKLKAREFALEQKLIGASQQISNQLNEVKQSLELFTSFMTEEGAARSRMTVKHAKEEAQTSLYALKTSCEEIKRAIADAENRLEHTINQTLTHVANITESFPAGEFKHVTQKSCDDIKSTSTSAIRQIADYVRQFHRKNLVMAFVLTLFMAFILGLYLNGEWPWEIHQEVLKERNAGRALIAAWPKLTPAEQQAIQNAAERDPIT